MSEHSQQPMAGDESVRAHSFDGIQEFDKRLPNWWLWTLYVMVLFSFGYWFYYQWPGPGNVISAGEWLDREMTRIEVEASTRAGGDLNDAQLWKMSQDPQIVASGRTTFLTTCASCHGPEAKGLIGPNLTDEVWIHGGRPQEIVTMVTKGSLEKGMPQWGPQLGRKKIVEVVSYILSLHTPPAN